jgi:hypothetical protein
MCSLDVNSPYALFEIMAAMRALKLNHGASLFAIRAFRSTDRSPAGFRAADRQLFDAWRPEQARLTRRHLFLRRVLGSAAGTLWVAE